jgi:hypothetical protein
MPMTTPLTGSLPVKPFHPTSLVGSVQSDGQRPRVAALACEPDGRVICLSLVGPATSVSSALAKLMDPNGRLFFEPHDGVAWDEPRILMRETGIAYKELSLHLRGTLEAHGLCLPLSAHLGDGLVHPPVIPQEESPADAVAAIPDEAARLAEQPAPPLDSLTRLRAVLAQARPRYLFGNWAEPTPHRRTFLGVLRGLRALFINAPPDAAPALTAAMNQWADALWRAGQEHDLISEGVRERWLTTP